MEVAKPEDLELNTYIEMIDKLENNQRLLPQIGSFWQL